jgi:hypothetical protein
MVPFRLLQLALLNGPRTNNRIVHPGDLRSLFFKRSLQDKATTYCQQLSKMIFSHGAINMASAPHPHPPFHKEGALARTAVREGGDDRIGTKQKNEHVSQLFILIHVGVGRWG